MSDDPRDEMGREPRPRTPTELAAVLNTPGGSELLGSATPTPVPMPDEEEVARISGGSAAIEAEPEALEIRVRDLRAALETGAGIVDLLLFRIGAELFAAELGSVDEAVDLPAIERLPEMPPSQLGIVKLRDRLVPLYTADRALGAAVDGEVATAIVTRPDDREDAPRVAIGIDDVIDVLTIEVASIGTPPSLKDPHGIQLGITRRDKELVAVVDVRALVAACLDGRIEETV